MWLRLAKMARRYHRMTQEVERLRSRCASVVAKYDTTPGGHAGGSQKDEALVRLAERSAQLDRYCREVLDQADQVGLALAGLRQEGLEDRLAHLLVHRYVEQQSLERARDSMAAAGYPCSKSTLCRWCKDLEEVLKQW